LLLDDETCLTHLTIKNGEIRTTNLEKRDSVSSFCADDEGVITPRKIKMKPENAPLEEEKHLPNHRFYVNLRGYK